MESKLFDVTLSLDSETPVWPGDPPAQIKRIAKIENGDGYNLSRICCPLHWGTHIDAPYHFNPDGWTTGEIPLDLLIGKVRVVRIADTDKIQPEHLQRFNLHGVKRLILKTDNSSFWSEKPLKFHQEFTAFTEETAAYLLSLQIKLVGIDYLSVDLFSDSRNPVHQAFCRENIVVLEGLDLREVISGDYQMICLPLKIENADGAPARVILKTIQDLNSER